MSRLTIDITEPPPPLKAMTAREGKAARRPADAQMFEPEVIEITDELRDFLNRRIEESLTEKITYKAVRDILAEELGEFYK